MKSWCRIRLRSERKMRNRNDSEGDCEVVEELRATYSERKREDEKQEQQKNGCRERSLASISRRVSSGAMLVALAMIFSYVESLIPINWEYRELN